ncbi:proton-coupled folate transporter [Drosophila busckii]|uniref:proton-coupled folate transporter n=1 Tax=Drosophila busckii TaxID=30019 RepID=UPI00083F0E9F|nr:proton-coupled folate transporter [Drosophila busckii]
MVESASISQLYERLKAMEWHALFHMFYLEPVVFVLIFSHVLSGTVMRNQIIYQTCTVSFQYNVSDCEQLDDKNAGPNIHAIETEIQSYVAEMFLSRTLIESIIPAVCGLFIGSWSDKYGRKPLLVISMIGFAGSALITTIICALSGNYAINPWWYTLAALPHSLLGGMCVFSVAGMCFLSDITDIKTRPYRMVFLELLVFIGLSSGTFLSSYVYAATNAAITQGISASCLIAATIFIIIWMPESLHIRLAEDAKAEAEQAAGQCEDATIEKPAKTTTNDLNLDQSKKQTEPEPEPAVGLFSTTHLKDMFKTCLEPREYNAREIIWLVTLAMFMTIFVVDGVMTVMYLYVRQQFHWSVREFTFFETISQLVSMLGALIGFLLLRKVFGLSVVTLALLSLCSDVFSNLIRGFATLPWHMYLSIVFGVFRSIGGPMCSTIVSNIVPASDLGKIFSIKNVMQSFAPFVAAPLYTLIYQHSLAVCPGLFNFLNALLYLIAFIAIGCVLRFKLKHKQHYAKILK